MKQFTIASVSDAAIREAVEQAKAHHKATGEHVQVMHTGGICFYVQKENRFHGMTVEEAIKSAFA